MKHFGPEAAERALARWEADSGTLRHVATSGNTVYRFRCAGEDRILRLTDPGHRTSEQNLAEMSFLLHLRREGVPACAPVPSTAGELVETLEDGSACVLTWARGTRVEPELPRTRENYGMIHADFAPSNFHYDRERGISSFDCGNCREHWFVSDLAISLSTLRRHPERERYRAWILEGYGEVLTPDPVAWEHLSWFLRLRILYVYLSRLDGLGPEPSAEQRGILRGLRAAVAERFEWA